MRISERAPGKHGPAVWLDTIGRATGGVILIKALDAVGTFAFAITGFFKAIKHCCKNILWPAC
jgi:uncharacterized membrane protein YeiH